MASISKTQTIPTAEVPRLVSAFGSSYQDKIDNPDFDPEQPEGEDNPKLIDNPQTKQQYASDKYDEFVKTAVKNYVRGFEQEQARKGVPNDFEIE